MLPKKLSTLLILGIIFGVAIATSFLYFNHIFNSPDGDAVAKQLAEKVRVLCWIMTGPQNHQSRAKHVKATWGRRCNKLMFMSSEADPILGSVKLNVSEGRQQLWEKTKQAFEYIYKNHFDEADWFVKADDDTYMIVENLRLFLSQHSPTKPLYFGGKFEWNKEEPYFTGGPGFVLSKAAVKKLVEGYHDKTKCGWNVEAVEDVLMGKCMKILGVPLGETRDKYGMTRFFHLTPEHHLIPGVIPKNDGYWKHNSYPEKPGLAAVSDTAISFHYIKPNMMYVFEYLIYHLKPYGITTGPKDLLDGMVYDNHKVEDKK